jgi:hypothetical protein
MQKPGTWQELLSHIIEDPHERERVAALVKVSPVTLTRWVKQESKPRAQNVRNLLLALPQYRDVFLSLLTEEEDGLSPEFLGQATPTDNSVISSDFYGRLLHTYTQTSENLLYPLIAEQIVELALKQLDPQRLGMAISLVRGGPLHQGGMIHSLRELSGRGTLPWEDRQTMLAFLGAESLAGSAITSNHLQVNQRLGENNTAPGYPDRWEVSAAAAPIMRAGKTAGCLLVSSTQLDYFTAARCMLVEKFAEMLSLAFAPGDYYSFKQIELRIMPPLEEQRPVLSLFRQRTNQAMIQATREGRQLTVIQAEEQAWQQIEEELLDKEANI